MEDTKDWRDYRVQHSSRSINDSPSWFDKELIKTTFPFLTQTANSTKEKPLWIASGTGFFFVFKDYLLLVTAFHCVFNDDNSPKPVLFGFQGNIAAKRIIVKQEVYIDKVLPKWIVNQELDIAILPIIIDKNIRDQIYYNYFTEENLAHKIWISKQNSGIILGYGHQQGSLTHKIDKSLADQQNLNEDEIKRLEETGLMTWIPISSFARFMGISCDESIIDILGVTISGFSGGPFILSHNGQNLLFGTVSSSIEPIKKWNEQKGMYQYYTSEKGLVTSINEVLKLLDKHNKDLQKPLQLTIEDIVEAHVTYENNEEMYFHPW
jgi:hypothetical protein